MRRYVAFVWDPQDVSATQDARLLVLRWREGAHEYKTVLEANGLCVLCAGSVQVWPVGCGLLLGSLFSKPGLHPDDAAPERIALNPADAQRAIMSGGRELVAAYWGDYVAIFREWDGSAVRVLRGPFTTINCLQTRYENVVIYASDIERCADVSGRRFSVDWHAIARTFLGPMPSGRTHLNGVRELVPGTCDRIVDSRVTSQCLWNASQLSYAAPVRDHNYAARLLRTITRACVQARASEFDALLMGLSGGLDSSITLSSLASGAAPPRVICLNHYVDGTDSDERHYARLAARAAGCELREYRREQIEDLRTATYQHRLAISPGLRIPTIDRIEPDAACEIGAGAIFDGNGGDELFCRVHHWLYVSDYLRAHSFDEEVLAHLTHAAFTEGITVWRILARCLYFAARPHRLNLTGLIARDIHGATLLKSEVIRQLIEEPPPENPDRRLPVGRRWQISLLSARRSTDSPHWREGDPVRVSPLLSQPIVELCLRIPTWFQIRRRRDRALARDAFAGDVPLPILHRHDKGGAEAVASTIIHKNLSYLREVLLDGLVAKSGIIDRPRLEAALSNAPPSDGVTSVPLFDLFGAEAWSRTWQGQDHRCSPQKRLRTETLYAGSSSQL